MSTNDPLDTTPLPGYKIGREIGSGSFAKVFLGHTTAIPNKTVAIKSVLRSRLTKKLLENLESEISILKGIRHPHVVSLIDITNTGTHIHLIMEYCPLGDLSFFIKKRDKLGQEGQIPLLRDIASQYPNTKGAGLNETLVRHFLKQLASALQFLRSRNLMHRDVKPQNLLLQPPASVDDRTCIGLPSLPVLKLADFGFARYLQSSSMAETLCGSPLYMAPEILRYEKYDASADLWSVGTVLFEMLVGKPPFRAHNHVELLRRIEESNDEIKFPRDVLLNEEIKTLIRALLKRNPKDRISFENFFSDNILHESLQAEVPIVMDADTVIANSMMVRPGHIRQAEVSSRPVSVPLRNVRSNNDAGDAEAMLPSPAFITDLIPLHTPPVENPLVRPLTSVDRRDIVVSSTENRRRVSMPMGSSRPQISPSHPQPVPMVRRPSHRAETRPELMGKTANDSENRDRSKLSRRVDSRDQVRDRDRDSEGEYVVIEKKTVEVNAFADALARSPRPGTFSRKHSAQLAHAVSQNLQISGSSSPQPNVATVQTLATAERRLGSSPASALAKALNIASQRLFGGGSPPSWLEQMVNNANRIESSTRHVAKGGDLVGLWSPTEGILSPEEDQLIAVIEGIAIKSAIVYNFAELKLRQLIPPPPSQSDDDPDNLLTNEAIVSLCEEAMVLYLKTLQLLQKNIDLVQDWVNRNTGSGASPKLNQVIQWTRHRYNEVLEKAEYLQQKKATTLALVATDYPFEEVTAEKLLYDRALEMSRGAAVNEIVGEDLSQCEGDYEISVLMLEAILECSSAATDSAGASSGETIIEEEDRKVIEKWATLTRGRLRKLRTKLDHLTDTNVHR